MWPTHANNSLTLMQPGHICIEPCLVCRYEAAAEGPAALEGDSTVPEATVVILRLNGQKFTLSIAHIETVGELKHLVAEETGVPADKMMLYSAPLDKHYRLVDSHKLLDDEPDGYKYGTGRDTTILMWESLVDDDNKLRFPNDAVMSWVDYTSSPYNAAVKLPALSSLGRLLTGRSSVTSGGWGICGTWLPVQISKKDISDKCKSDVVPTRSGMFIERQYRPGLKKVQAISIPYVIHPCLYRMAFACVVCSSCWFFVLGWVGLCAVASSESVMPKSASAHL